MDEHPAIRCEKDDHGIVHVVFGRPDERTCVLGLELLQELDRVLTELPQLPDVRGVLLRTARPGNSLVGLDVREIEAVDDPYLAADKARFGQSVMQRVAQLAVPSACAIDGRWIGAGAELALAGTFRVASDRDAVRVGLPQVRLGVIPGFGGTQRLPRLVGLEAALDLIVTGRLLDGRDALHIGLVDRVVPAPLLRQEACRLLVRAAGDTARTISAVRRARPRAPRLLEKAAFGRRLIQARARGALRSSGNAVLEPAPARAAEAVEAAFTLALPQGLDLEARIVAELVPTPQARNRMWLHRACSARKAPGATLGAAPRAVRKVGVLGAGRMGGGISGLLAELDVSVRLADVRLDAILAGLRTAAETDDREMRDPEAATSFVERKMRCIAPTLEYSGLARADLIVEACTEDLAVKQRVLREAERRIDERAVYASNTSSLTVRQIAAHAERPDRVVGMHFFHPVRQVSLVEIVGGPSTSGEALATAHALAVRLGKTPVVVRDTPGFLVNRVLAVYFAEALRLFRDGVRIDAVDGAMVAFGMPHGPFSLMDRIGLPGALVVARHLQAAYGERVAAAAEVLERLIRGGRHGVPGGRGFYRYRGGRKTLPDPGTYKTAGVVSRSDIPAEMLQERMVLIMANEAVTCLQEGVVRGAAELDVALVLGAGFPSSRGGVLRYVDEIGVAAIRDRLSRLADSQGERFRPADRLEEMAPDEKRFYPEG